jgi:hypothetical protein
VFRKEWGFDSLHGHQPSLLRSYGWQASFINFDEAAKATRRSPEGEDGGKYVYLLESIEDPESAVCPVRSLMGDLAQPVFGLEP